MKTLLSSSIVFFLLIGCNAFAQTPNKITTDAGTFMEVLTRNESYIPNSWRSSIAITTLFASNNSFNGNMFDIEVIGSEDIIIQSFDVNLSGTTDMFVFYKEGTYVGSETTAGAWTLAGTQFNVIGQGQDNPTPLSIGGINLEAGKVYGFYVTTAATGYNHPTISLHYTDGANTYFDANLKIIAGVALGGDALFQDVFSPRTWNGTIYYDFLAPAVPLSNWALYLGIFLMVMFTAIRFRKMV